MVSGLAWDGETPAAWMSPVTHPKVAACSASDWTDAREATSTTAVETSKPASAITVAAACALSSRRSARTTRFPALTRGAMACPIDPLPMTTTTSVVIPKPGRRARRAPSHTARRSPRRATWLSHPPGW